MESYEDKSDACSRQPRDYQNKNCHLKTNDPAGWRRQIKLLTQGRRDQPPITVPGVDCNGQFEHVANLIIGTFPVLTDHYYLHIYCTHALSHVQPREVHVY